MSEWIGLLLSYLFVFLTIGVSTAFLRLGRIDAQTARKVIHIGVSNWWILAMASMRDPWIASIGPVTFIVLNLVSLRTGLFSAMEGGRQGRNWGTVYFPISLLVLVNLSYRSVMPVYVGGIAALVMGWGDGLAAIVGRRLGRRKIGPTVAGKSVAGSIAMFAASAVVTAVFAVSFEPGEPLWRTLLVAPLATAAFATVIELLTPWGVDNLTVPLATAVFYRFAFLPIP